LGIENINIFIQMIELTSIMAEVIDVFYTQRANAEFEKGGRNATRLILERAKPVQLKLKEWFSKLPAVARMDAYTPGKLSSNGKRQEIMKAGDTCSYMKQDTCILHTSQPRSRFTDVLCSRCSPRRPIHMFCTSVDQQQRRD